MKKDTYEGLAERYDRMMVKNPAREEFFRKLFANHGVRKVLDCACGTGHDLIMFNRMGFDVLGSDLSEAMLTQARKNMRDAGVQVPVHRADFCRLEEHFEPAFDAVVCLTNAINEALDDAGTLQALRGMRSVLRADGILVFDQGQTDATMQNPPRFATVVNSHDFTRFFTMEYAGDLQTVNIFDFIHTKDESEVMHSSVRIRIRLFDSWREILRQAGLDLVESFGDWNWSPYDKRSSRRLIAVVKNSGLAQPAPEQGEFR
jgi:SAM-dependent methyltransferase